MAKQLQLRKGTATEHSTFTGANGEVTVDTTNKTLRVHDGSTVGGTMLATFTENRGLGIGQTWQSVTGSRTNGTTYTNSTGKPILVNVCASCSDLDGGLTVTVDGVLVGFSYGQQDNGSGLWQNTITFIVPNLKSYVVLGGSVIAFWVELR